VFWKGDKVPLLMYLRVSLLALLTNILMTISFLEIDRRKSNLIGWKSETKAFEDHYDIQPTQTLIVKK